jgi:hypothetical protein
MASLNNGVLDSPISLSLKNIGISANFAPCL